MGTTPRRTGKTAMAFDLFTLAGIAGTALFLAAYFANQQGWLMAEDWRYPLANLVAAILILLSLITAWNLPAAVIEGIWAAISVYGLIKHAGRSVRR
jgi:paired small multidrug resistance pump